MSEVIEDLKRAVFRIGGVDPLYGGPTLSDAVEDVDAKTAKCRPTNAGRTIWEIVLHAAYWRHEVAHALSSGAIDRFSRGPENWPTLPDTLDAQAWDSDLQLLRESEQAVLDAFRTFEAERWSDPPVGGGDWTVGQLALGLVAHDAYHIGQVALLKKIARGC